MTTSQLMNWWAAQAMIDSYTHVNSITAGTSYHVRGPIGISQHIDGENAAPFQVEFLALEANPERVATAIKAYTPKPRVNFVLDVFHEERNPTDLADQYRSFGFDYRRTEAIFGVNLPQDKGIDRKIDVYRLGSEDELASVNPELQQEGEMIAADTLNDEHIRNYYAVLDGKIAGWSQLVIIHAEAGFVNQLYTLTPYRRRGVGLALIDRIHSTGWKSGKSRMLLIPSEIGKGLYAKYDYRPLLYFSVFRPTTFQE